jgi:hypothetical protein
MKTRILSILLCLTLSAFAILPEVVPAQIVKAVAAAGTPEQLTATRTQCQSLVIQARKNTTTANAGNVYIGFTSAASSQKLVLQPGESVSITAGTGKAIDLSGIYIDAATNADAVCVTYVPN